MNSLLLLAALSCAQQNTLSFQQLLAASVVPETRLVSVAGVMVLKVKAEVKVLAHSGQDVEGNVVKLQKKYGFILDKNFEPQAITGDKEFVVLPYDTTPRPMYFLVKGFINEERMAELAQDALVRKVEQDSVIEASEKSLHFFVQGYGPALLKVKGVQGLAVGAQEKKAVIVITLQADADRDETAERLRRAAPPLALLPHRYERSAQKAEPRFRTQ